MAIPVVTIRSDATNIFSPFTGCVVADSEGLHEDRSLLFSYVGNAAEWEYAAPSIGEVLEKDEELEAASPDDVCRRLTIRGAFCLCVDAGWNGVNYYAFVPIPGEEAKP